MNAGPFAGDRTGAEDHHRRRRCCRWSPRWWSAPSTTGSAGRRCRRSVVVVGNILVVVGLGLRSSSSSRTTTRPRPSPSKRTRRWCPPGCTASCAIRCTLGALIMMVGTPLALGLATGDSSSSRPRLPVVGPAIIDEEKMLREELDGYAEYTEKVRYRLVPACGDYENRCPTRNIHLLSASSLLAWCSYPRARSTTGGVGRSSRCSPRRPRFRARICAVQGSGGCCGDACRRARAPSPRPLQKIIIAVAFVRWGPWS